MPFDLDVFQHAVVRTPANKSRHINRLHRLATKTGALSGLVFAAFALWFPLTADAGERWTTEEANAWYAQQAWPVGANFVPSTAINQLEMWQEATFDPETIDRELGWAADIGFNCMRVYLHDLLWKQDPAGFIARIDDYLEIAGKHGIKTMFVLFDSVWDPQPKLGPQPDPKPGTHNSGWVQSPHIDLLKDRTRHVELKPYVIGILSHYKNDDRVLAWDLLNEPGNRAPPYRQYDADNKVELCQIFLDKVFDWAREVDPSQPLTTGIWGAPKRFTDPRPLDKLMLERSDIITFHTYMPLAPTREVAGPLKAYNRPIICTEYMARTAGSTFQELLPYFKEENIGAINWGLVSGRSQTIYPWSSWEEPFDEEPETWFHDVFRHDGTPYSRKEVALIKVLTE